RKLAPNAAAAVNRADGPFNTIGDQKPPGALGLAQRFRPFSVADQMCEGREAGPPQTLFDSLAEERVDFRVRNDCKAASLIAERGAGDLAGQRQRAAGDGDVVTTFV